MDGNSVFKFAVRVLAEVAQEVCAAAGIATLEAIADAETQRKAKEQVEREARARAAGSRRPDALGLVDLFGNAPWPYNDFTYIAKLNRDYQMIVVRADAPGGRLTRPRSVRLTPRLAGD